MKKDIKFNEVVRFLKKQGFEQVTNGNHCKFRRENGEQLMVPNHRRVKGSTLKDQLRNVGLRLEDV